MAPPLSMVNIEWILMCNRVELVLGGGEGGGGDKPAAIFYYATTAV